VRVLFRVDASVDIGTGHVMRCRTLGLALKKQGADVDFIMRQHKGHLGELLVNDGFKVHLLSMPTDMKLTKAKYADWLGVSQEFDASQTIECMKDDLYDWIIVDHYGLDEKWEKL